MEISILPNLVSCSLLNQLEENVIGEEQNSRKQGQDTKEKTNDSQRQHKSWTIFFPTSRN